MRERPILMSAPMVRAILAGTKTQTRRIVKPQPELNADYVPSRLDRHTHHPEYHWPSRQARSMVSLSDMTACCPYGAPGDRLWVKESHSIECEACNAGLAVLGGCVCRTRAAVRYRADTDGQSKGWRPSIHMPRWASRITLEVTGVRVERLHGIDELGALAEGVEGRSVESVLDGKRGEYIVGSAREAFAALWDEINGKPSPMLDDDGEPVLDDNERPIMVASRSWASNPWVWVVEFKRVAEPIADLINRSSIGAGLRNIRENGIEGELRSLDEEMHGGRR